MQEKLQIDPVGFYGAIPHESQNREGELQISDSELPKNNQDAQAQQKIAHRHQKKRHKHSLHPIQFWQPFLQDPC